ncbi:MAG: spore germination protein [Lachnospiraceae bacterium]|nr:spore germination protein [Lachnospiraceae bacterium]MBQ2320898.1 spore germination protein [Lachnospiraceae bacterium]
MENNIFAGSFEDRIRAVNKLLNMDMTFDILQREVTVGGRKAVLVSIDSLLNSELSQKIVEYFYSIAPENMPQDYDTFANNNIPFVDVSKVEDEDKFIGYIMSGMTCVIIDGYREIAVLDLRKYPARDVSEPDKDKVLRGSRDGFVESFMQNIGLIRRRIRDVNLIFETQKVGRSSKTDIAISYMNGRCDRKVIDYLKKKISDIDVDSLTMNQESFAEAVFPRNWINPFPKFKYTERADTAAACILEGSVVILIDNSSSAMIVPTSLFDIIEDANDYYFPPITGTYLRMVRMLTSIVALFITPVFLFLLQRPDLVPEQLEFILIHDEINVHPLIQFLILELVVDGLKMASVNTPSMLSTPLSVVAAIIFGDYTVSSGWFNSQIMLYMAFVAVANYTQSNMELGYAIKFMRIILLILTNFFGGIGLAIGTIFIMVSIAFNKIFVGRSYLYPLVPFDGVQLLKRFFRISIISNEKLSNNKDK